MTLPGHTKYVIIGAGIHGLSTALHLAELLTARGSGTGADVLVLDKTGIGAGASGTGCGIVRNTYASGDLRRLILHSVSSLESEPDAFGYHSVGHLQVSSEDGQNELAAISTGQRQLGYASTLVEGAADSRLYLDAIFADWQAQKAAAVLHEHRGGYVDPQRALQTLADRASSVGVAIRPGVDVTGLAGDGGAVTGVETSDGTIRCDRVVVAAGPWVRDFWRMLDLPHAVNLPDVPGACPMWTYTARREAVLGGDPALLVDNNDDPAPVVHVDSDAPLHDDVDGSLVTTEPWSTYFKFDPDLGGVQGGATAGSVNRQGDGVELDPYGAGDPDLSDRESFARLWTSALAHCLQRFAGKGQLVTQEPNGGLACHTPDGLPVFDVFRGNVYVIADASHGYELIGAGALVAEELLGNPQELLEPFRFSRYAIPPS